MSTTKKFEETDPTEWASFHDTVLEATEQDASQDELERIFETLPEQVQGIAGLWGLSDSVFRDEAYVFLKEKKDGR